MALQHTSLDEIQCGIKTKASIGILETFMSEEAHRQGEPYSPLPASIRAFRATSSPHPSRRVLGPVAEQALIDRTKHASPPKSEDRCSTYAGGALTAAGKVSTAEDSEAEHKHDRAKRHWRTAAVKVAAVQGIGGQGHIERVSLEAMYGPNEGLLDVNTALLE